MKELVKLVVVLTAVCTVAGVLLAITQKLTAEPIRQAERQELFDSLSQILPPGDGDPVTLHLPAPGGSNTFYITRRNGALAGIAFSCVSSNGYGGPVEALVGLTPEGAIVGMKVTQKETPGLGTRIADPPFLKQFTNAVPLEGSLWKVKKDGGPIDAVSGATISSRALCAAVANGVKLYTENRAALAAAAAGTVPSNP